MKREQALLQVEDNLSYFNDCKFPFAVSECKKWINKIYDDFEEELKKAYIEGSNSGNAIIKMEQKKNQILMEHISFEATKKPIVFCANCSKELK